jgi:hypothetical protein
MKFVVNTILLGLLGWGLYGWMMSDISYAEIAAQCPRMIRDAVVAFSVLGLFAAIITMVRNSSMVGGIMGLLFGSGVIIVGSILGILLMKDVFGMTATTYCPNCNAPTEIRELREDGMLSAAEERARRFIGEEQVRPEGGYDIKTAKQCLAEGEVELARVLLTKAGNITNELEPERFEDEKDFESCSEAVTAAESYLNDALVLADQATADGSATSNELATVIRERQKNLALLAGRCQKSDDVPDLVRQEYYISGSEAFIKVALEEDGSFLANSAGILDVRSADGKAIKADVEEKSAGASICTMIVADNSGSIAFDSNNRRDPALLVPIHAAIRRFNSFVKPTDQIGLVVFGDRSEVKTIHRVGNEVIDTNRIDASGTNTAMWDGVDLGIKEMDECLAERRQLILVTDGADNSSVLFSDVPRSERAERIVSYINEQTLRRNIDVCVIAVGKQVENDKSTLEQISGSCGYYSIANFGALESQMADLYGDSNEHYLIRFDQAQMMPSRKVRVVLKGTSQGVTVDFNK